METRTRWVVGVSLLGAVLFGPGLVEWIRLSFKQRRLDHQLAELSTRREELAREQTRLESDSVYVESLIRTTFKLSKPGEYVIPIDSPASRTATADPTR